MGQMGIAAIYRKRNTSAPHPKHPVYPSLMKHLIINRPNQVWASDITYIPMKRGFVYLVAILDWATRKVLAHRVSISMTSDFCIEALEERHRQLRNARNLQHRPRQSVHQRRIYPGTERPCGQDQHGWQGPLAR